MRIERILRMTAWTGAIFFLLINMAFAVTLEEAKAAGQIGEKRDGYIGLVQADAPAEVAALVASVNEERRARYEQIAEQNGIPVEQVAQLAFAKAVENTRPGNYVQSASGSWVRKPQQ